MDRDYLKFLYGHDQIDLADLKLSVDFGYISQSDYNWIIEEE